MLRRCRPVRSRFSMSNPTCVQAPPASGTCSIQIDSLIASGSDPSFSRLEVLVNGKLRVFMGGFFESSAYLTFPMKPGGLKVACGRTERGRVAQLWPGVFINRQCVHGGWHFSYQFHDGFLPGLRWKALHSLDPKKLGKLAGGCDLAHAAHGPGARHQGDRAVQGNGQARPQALAQRRLALITQRFDVAGRRPFAAQ